MKTITFSALLLASLTVSAQKFTRSELPATLEVPWELTYGPDDNLWLTEKGGKVSCVNPQTGAKTAVFQAADYFAGDPSEACANCFKPKIGSGTLGLALHPDFNDPATSFIYFVYSYNSGSSSAPATRFKIQRLKWDANSKTVLSDSTVVANLPNGYDHLGGRLLSVKQSGHAYLYFSVGDNGVSEDNEPTCYTPQSTNPNNFAQDVNTKNGKIHRFNMDGSIPANNPLPGNSFFTRGHRNPQGLIYNSKKDLLYDVEHGDRTDDEINVLHAGMNYGWKWVRGYHSDDNCQGELNYIYGYTANPGIPNDALKEPLFAWCALTSDTNVNNNFWGTVAPSDGIYYGGTAIPEWENSLLVVTLKDGNTCDRELYRFKMEDNGLFMNPSTSSDPNPKTYFGDDQKLNGRLRDIALSPDGLKIYLINNGGADRDKITVYTAEPAASVAQANSEEFRFDLFPNPASDQVTVHCTEKVDELRLFNVLGQERSIIVSTRGINIAGLSAGTYYVKIKTESGVTSVKKLVKN